MKALVNFIFMFDDSVEFPDGRIFLIEFDVTPSLKLGMRLKNQDENFLDDTAEFLDDLDINYAEDWPVGNSTSFGWLTNCHDDHGDPIQVVEKVRDYFLAEGFTGGEIREMSQAEFEDMEENDQTNALLEAAIAAL